MEDKKQKFISKKMEILVGKEGYSRPQAYAIALSYWEKGEKYAQQGDWYQQTPSLLNNYVGTPYTTYDPNAVFISDLSENNGMTNPELMPSKQQLAQNRYNNTALNNYDENGNAIDTTETNQNTNTRVNIPNLYGGMDLESSLAYTGRGFGEKDPFKIGVGTGLSILKGARNFLTGFATGKEDRRVAQEMYKRQFENKPTWEYGQQGKEVTNAEMLTGQFVADQGQGNINVEGDEYVKMQGEVKQVVGEPHVKNGKKADGVDINLQNGDKVLSNYTKIGAKNAKELKERYNVSVKKDDTFAKVQSKIDKKLGIQELTDELADYIKKIGKNESVKDIATRALNESVLAKEIEEYKKKLDVLKEPQAMIFEDLFKRQEQIPKKGNGKQLLDKDGKVIEEHKGIAQQGGKINGYDNVQKPIKDIKYNVSTTGIREGSLPDTQYYTRVEYNDGTFDYIKQDAEIENRFKRMPNYINYMNNLGKKQNIEKTAQKYQIPIERAKELVSMQEGGMQTQQEEEAEGSKSNLQEEQKEVSQEQVIQFVAQSLQQGVTPEQIIQQLSQMGISPEQSQQIIKMVAEQMQQAPQIAQQGKEYMQEAGSPYTFSTKARVPVTGYDIEGNVIVNEDTLSDVEYIQPYTGKGYGAKMASVDDTIKLHSWYFDTEEKKQDFRDAVTKEGTQKPIEDFQKAYNEEIKNRAKSAGVSDEEINKLIQDVGFTGKGVQQFDGKFGAFTSTRPLFTFKKAEGNKPAIETVITPQEIEKSKVETINQTKNVLPWLPQDLRMFPSALNPISKQEVPLSRLEAIKMTPETMLANQALQLNTANEQIQNLGLSPTIQQAGMATNLASSQIASNDAIAKVEQFNAQNKQGIDQFNLQQRDKENLLKAQFDQDYEKRMFGSLNAQERDLRNFYIENNLQNRQNFKDIENINLQNATRDQFAYVPGQGIVELNNQPTNMALQSLSQAEYDALTPAQKKAYIQSKLGGIKLAQ